MCMLPSTLRAHASSPAGPVRNFPFQNRLACVLLTAVAVLMDDLTNCSGGSAISHPVQPYKSVLRPLLHATLTSVRTMDSLTDLNIVGLLLEKVCIMPHDTHLALRTER